jgi:bifunctional non-homologous end joining protein LigD
MILRPMLATPAPTLPQGSDWTYEVKWDGYRALAVKTGSRVRLISRNEKDLTRDYPSVVTAVASLRAKDLILDGEIVALDQDGRPSFQRLQHKTKGAGVIAFYAFDLLSLNGRELLTQPLELRRTALAKAVKQSKVLLSEPLEGTVQQLERAIRRHGLEGIVAKRRDSSYRPGQRTDAWIKVKFSAQQEFVVGGFKPGGPNFDSILVGYYEGRQLYFAAKVRAGFTPYLRAEVYRRLAGTNMASCPFVNLPNSTGRSRWGAGVTADDMAALQWVKPSQVVEVAFVEWTRDGLLRHPKFVGMRDDKSARIVHREAQ